jgi:hypothetical protein
VSTSRKLSGGAAKPEVAERVTGVEEQRRLQASCGDVGEQVVPPRARQHVHLEPWAACCEGGEHARDVGGGERLQRAEPQPRGLSRDLAPGLFRLVEQAA